ncbi:MAG: hypothetical protein A2Z52_01850 [Candidatus Moranbacteria bacterium RBG_19FT_COMBO_42_6]|nr:MAG: hypothetical protein A2Z52_01850 [Candidatus Moranbacteria bacterium RBG_19FT_COMBO_42_6]
MKKSKNTFSGLPKKELQEFKRQLLEQRQETIERLIQANAKLGDSLKRYIIDQGADPSDRPQIPTTEGTIERGLIQKLENTENALKRIDNGTFGICHRCGGEIGKARLKAVPTTRLCMSLECEEL